MALIYADRVKEQSTTIGTGTLTLNGAIAGFRTFNNAIGTTNESFYVIVNDADNAWEVGRGTVQTSTTFSRDTVIASSNSNLLVNFVAGTKTVAAVAPSTFFSSALDTSAHALINHTGLPGVPAPEAFDATAHQAVDHTLAPFNLLTSTVHDAIDHTIAPFSLLDAAGHAAIDHSSIVTGTLTSLQQVTLPRGLRVGRFDVADGSGNVTSDLFADGQLLNMTDSSAGGSFGSPTSTSLGYFVDYTYGVGNSLLIRTPNNSLAGRIRAVWLINLNPSTSPPPGLGSSAEVALIPGGSAGTARTLGVGVGVGSLGGGSPLNYEVEPGTVDTGVSVGTVVYIVIEVDESGNYTVELYNSTTLTLLFSVSGNEPSMSSATFRWQVRGNGAFAGTNNVDFYSALISSF